MSKVRLQAMVDIRLAAAIDDVCNARNLNTSRAVSLLLERAFKLEGEMDASIHRLGVAIAKREETIKELQKEVNMLRRFYDKYRYVVGVGDDTGVNDDGSSVLHDTGKEAEERDRLQKMVQDKQQPTEEGDGEAESRHDADADAERLANRIREQRPIKDSPKVSRKAGGRGRKPRG